MRWKTFWLAVLGVGLVVIGAWVIANRRSLADFPSIISSFYAKQMCSCLFVVGQTEDHCRNEARQYVPISGYDIDWQARSVTVRGLGRSNRARYVGERYGCVLDPYRRR